MPKCAAGRTLVHALHQQAKTDAAIPDPDPPPRRQRYEAELGALCGPFLGQDMAPRRVLAERIAQHLSAQFVVVENPTPCPPPTTPPSAACVIWSPCARSAEDLDIRVVGHLPGNRELLATDVIGPGLAMIAHAEELSWLAQEQSDAVIAELTQLMLDNNVALTSTLFLNRQIAEQTRDPAMIAETEGLATLHPIEMLLWFAENPYVERRTSERIDALEAIDEFNRLLVKAFVDAGVPVFAGTDASFIPGLAPGLSLHQELATLVDAGLSPTQALEAATVVPARWLGILDDRGTLERGKRANLVLLNADPLADIRNTREIDSVFVNGERFDRAHLDNRLRDLEDVYAPFYPYLSPAGAAALAQQGRPW